jgi:hypothetical protein
VRFVEDRGGTWEVGQPEPAAGWTEERLIGAANDAMGVI